MYEEFWIGLKTEWSSERRSYEWKWVDGSPLTKTWDILKFSFVSHSHKTSYFKNKSVIKTENVCMNVCEEVWSCFINQHYSYSIYYSICSRIICLKEKTSQLCQIHMNIINIINWKETQWLGNHLCVSNQWIHNLSFSDSFLQMSITWITENRETRLLHILDELLKIIINYRKH